MKIRILFILPALYFLGCTSLYRPALPGNANPDRFYADIKLRGAYRAALEGDLERSADLYQEFFKKGEESVYSRTEYARVLLRLDRTKEALLQARRAVELDGGNLDASLVLVDALLKNGDRTEALELLRSCNLKFPDNGELEFRLAELLFDLSRPNEAKVHYTQALFYADTAGSRGPAFRSISLWRLANIYLREKDEERARVYLLRYLKYNPDSLYGRFVLGYFIYFQKGDYRRATPQLEYLGRFEDSVAAEQNVDMTVVRWALGQIYFLNNDDRSVSLLQRVLYKRPKEVLARGLYDTWTGNDREALSLLVPYARSRPDHLVSRVAILRILERQNNVKLLAPELMNVATLAGRFGQNRIGVDLTRMALRLKEENPGLGISLSRIYQLLAGHYEAMLQYQRAILYLQLAIETGDAEKRWKNEGERMELELSMARLMSGATVGRVDEALAIVDGVLRQNPDLTDAYYIRGIILLDSGKTREALASLDRAVALDGNRIQSLFFRAVAHDALGDFPATEKDLKRVLELNPDFAEACNFLGYLYAERNLHPEKARELIERAIRNSPTSGAYQDSLGWLLFREEKYKEARYHIQLAALLLEDEGHEDPVVFDHLGDVYEKLQMPERAANGYRRALMLLQKRKSEPRDRGGMAESVDPEKKASQDRELEVRIRKKLDQIRIRGTEHGNAGFHGYRNGYRRGEESA